MTTVIVQVRIADGKPVSAVYHEPKCKWVANRATPPREGTEYRRMALGTFPALKPHRCS